MVESVGEGLENFVDYVEFEDLDDKYKVFCWSVREKYLMEKGFEYVWNFCF